MCLSIGGSISSIRGFEGFKLRGKGFEVPRINPGQELQAQLAASRAANAGEAAPAKAGQCKPKELTI